MKKMPAGKFKAQCLAVMNEVQQTGVPVLITKHGKPVAKLVPAPDPADDVFGYMAGLAQLLEPLIVVPIVADSSPIVRPPWQGDYEDGPAFPDHPFFVRQV